ncbi:hypothetical protein [Hydrogenimonas cancrithermarum]|uniref:Glycine zipper domain-containing protein n=1 Tax=Hydrogenimonas cancrithermarum TaxID=2993563 RepID=A0ABM8FKP4_9BACT|nr:hypothetical protein [Hydrogenimonas cancrithermarum]BDY11902.1 hypothetical protein HCR_02140 [Hydrogenimonas cancrithermarum]
MKMISLALLVVPTASMASMTGYASRAVEGALIGTGTCAFFSSLFGGRKDGAIGGISGAVIGANEDERSIRSYYDYGNRYYNG